MYCTPKIYKEGTPLRPIVDYTGSIMSETSRELANILGPLVGLTEHHVMNSKAPRSVLGEFSFNIVSLRLINHIKLYTTVLFIQKTRGT